MRPRLRRSITAREFHSSEKEIEWFGNVMSRHVSEVRQIEIAQNVLKRKNPEIIGVFA